MLAKTLVAIAAMLAAGACAGAESFNAKPGAWEMSVTTVTTGNPIPADVLEALPPDKRAEIEASMKERSGKADTDTFKSCVTQQDLDQNSMIKSESDSKCTRKVVSKSSTKIVVEQTCPPPRASTARRRSKQKTRKHWWPPSIRRKVPGERFTST